MTESLARPRRWPVLSVLLWKRRDVNRELAGKRRGPVGDADLACHRPFASLRNPPDAHPHTVWGERLFERSQCLTSDLGGAVAGHVRRTDFVDAEVREEQCAG